MSSIPPGPVQHLLTARALAHYEHNGTSPFGFTATVAVLLRTAPGSSVGPYRVSTAPNGTADLYVSTIDTSGYSGFGFAGAMMPASNVYGIQVAIEDLSYSVPATYVGLVMASSDVSGSTGSGAGGSPNGGGAPVSGGSSANGTAGNNTTTPAPTASYTARAAVSAEVPPESLAALQLLLGSSVTVSVDGVVLDVTVDSSYTNAAVQAVYDSGGACGALTGAARAWLAGLFGPADGGGSTAPNGSNATVYDTFWAVLGCTVGSLSHHIPFPLSQENVSVACDKWNFVCSCAACLPTPRRSGA